MAVADITVTRAQQSTASFMFDVVIVEGSSQSQHEVTLTNEDWDAQGDRFSSPEDFVRHSMEFLLEREPKESILGRFDIRDIGRYFPEFELRTEA